jgi:hypothetical protein
MSTFPACEVLYPHGVPSKTVEKCVVVLRRKNRRRHKNGDLLSVHHRLERRAYRYFRFSKTNVAADQPVHRR